MLEHNSRNKDETKKEETQVTLFDLMGLSRAQLDIDPQKATSHHHICRNPSSTTPAELVELTFLLGTLGFLHEKTLLLSLFLLSPCSGSASPPTSAPPKKRGSRTAPSTLLLLPAESKQQGKKRTARGTKDPFGIHIFRAEKEQGREIKAGNRVFQNSCLVENSAAGKG